MCHKSTSDLHFWCPPDFTFVVVAAMAATVVLLSSGHSTESVFPRGSPSPRQGFSPYSKYWACLIFMIHYRCGPNVLPSRLDHSQNTSHNRTLQQQRTRRGESGPKFSVFQSFCTRLTCFFPLCSVLRHLPLSCLNMCSALSLSQTFNCPLPPFFLNCWSIIFPFLNTISNSSLLSVL